MEIINIVCLKYLISEQKKTNHPDEPTNNIIITVNQIGAPIVAQIGRINLLLDHDNVLQLCEKCYINCSNFILSE